MNKIAPQDMRQHLMLNHSRLSTAEELPRKLKITGMQPRKNQAGFTAPVGKGLEKVENQTTLERVVARKAKEKCTEDADFNPSVVNSESLVDTAIGVGESAMRKPSVGSNKSTRRAIHLRTRCKETFANGQTRQRKGKVTASPRAKVKVGQEKTSRKREPQPEDRALPKDTDAIANKREPPTRRGTR